MADVRTIISRSLRLLGVLGDGSTAEASQMSTALEALNAMLSSWGLERLTLYRSATLSQTATSASFTVGPTGALVTPRPVEILSAYVRTNGVDLPIEIVGRERYEAERVKSVASDIPLILYYDATVPNGTVYLWPTPSSAAVFLAMQQPLSAYATVNDQTGVPDGYEQAFAFNLACQLQSEYGLQAPPFVTREASRTKALLKTANFSAPTLDSEPATFSRDTFNILYQ